MSKALRHYFWSLYIIDKEKDTFEVRVIITTVGPVLLGSGFAPSFVEGRVSCDASTFH
jgi:hypothetical protein